VITTEKYTGFRNDTYIITVGMQAQTHTHNSRRHAGTNTHTHTIPVGMQAQTHTHSYIHNTCIHTYLNYFTHSEGRGSDM
jgi:hypothetical protein